MAENRWISVVMKNKKTGETITLYHTPANGQEVDRHLRYAVLDLPAPADSDVSITALPGPADWLTAMVPPSAIPKR